MNFAEAAKDYLLSFDGITEEKIASQLNEWQGKRPKDMPTLYRAFIHHAKNRQGMPNSIGDIDKLRGILCDFDHCEIISSYSDWEGIFDALTNSDYRPPGRLVKNNPRSHWVIYCKSLYSVAKFLRPYKSIEEFNQFVDGFLTNEFSRAALPLLIAEEIFGFGFALACDFIKENISPEYIKPDTHVNDIAIGLRISAHGSSDYQIFKDTLRYCAAKEILPYELDKLFWLIGSGDFYGMSLSINSNKYEFIDKVIKHKKMADHYLTPAN